MSALAIVAVAGCGGTTTGREPDEYTGCGTDETWRTFEDQEPTRHGRRHASAAGDRAGGGRDGAVVDAAEADVAAGSERRRRARRRRAARRRTRAPSTTPARLSTLHLPPISGDAYDLQFTVDGKVAWRVITTLQEWARPMRRWRVEGQDGVAQAVADVGLAQRSRSRGRTCRRRRSPSASGRSDASGSASAQPSSSGAPPERARSCDLDLVGLHPAHALGHRRQQLVERRRLALHEAQRVDARDDERLRDTGWSARAPSASRPPRRPRRRARAAPCARRSRSSIASLSGCFEKAVDLLQDRLIGAAREAPALAIGEAERARAAAPRTRARTRLRAVAVDARQLAVHAHAPRATSRAGCAPSRC